MEGVENSKERGLLLLFEVREQFMSYLKPINYPLIYFITYSIIFFVAVYCSTTSIFLCTGVGTVLHKYKHVMVPLIFPLPCR